MTVQPHFDQPAAPARSNGARIDRTELDALDTSALVINGLAVLAGPANVVMQLAVPAVGYGVYESRVESGQLFKHPVKRTRTTLSYLAVATMGSPEVRRAYRKAVNTAHVQVRSTDDSPVEYNAMSAELQKWVAACLYKGWEDAERTYGDPSTITEESYQAGKVYGTTLQMPPEMWPATREDFEEYWQSTIGAVEIDDTIRGYLEDISLAKFAGPVVSRLFGWFTQTMTIGFLPQEFRDKMRLQPTPAQQRTFDTFNKVLAKIARHTPEPILRLPFTLLLADVKWRMRTGRPLI